MPLPRPRPRPLFLLVALVVAAVCLSSTTTAIHVIHVAAAAAADAAAAIPCPGPYRYHRSALRRLVSSRCGIWGYEGHLVDAATGKAIARVEGLELCRHLSELAYTTGSDIATATAAVPKAHKVRHKDTRSSRSTGTSIEGVDGSDVVNAAGSGISNGATNSNERGLIRMGDLLARTVLADKEDSTSTCNNSSSSSSSSSSDNNEREWDYATTVLSRRMFVYRPPPSSKEAVLVEGAAAAAMDTSSTSKKYRPPPSLLRSIKLRPTSPLKRLAISDSVQLYDVATTYISRHNGRTMTVLTEFPDGRWIMGSCQAEEDGGEHDSNGDNEWRGSGRGREDVMEYAVYARLGGSGGGSSGNGNNSKSRSSHQWQRRNRKDLPTLMPTRYRYRRRRRNPNDGDGGSGGDDDDGTVIVSPPRSKFIQFGKDQSVERARYGARETYAYEHLRRDDGGDGSRRDGENGAGGNILHRIRSLLPPKNAHTTSTATTQQPTVRYTRYGESPPWYRPSTPATLELRGRRLESIDDAPGLAVRTAARYVPGFFAVDCPIPTGGGRGGGGGSGGWSKSRRGRWRKRQQQQKQQQHNRLRREAEEAADAAAVRAVQFFRDPSSHGGEIVTLLDGTDDDEFDSIMDLSDPFASGGLPVRAGSYGRTVRRTSKRIWNEGCKVAGRILDSTAIRSGSMSANKGRR